MTMDVAGLLLLGLLFGMQHALEADHLAAVAALSARRSSPWSMALRGAWWGTGHTVALFLVCGGALLTGFIITSRMEAALEFAVGVMITLLGANVIRRVLRDHIRLRVHRHADGRPHIHALAATAGGPTGLPVEHRHRDGFVRPLLVGIVHGAAGSGALLAILVATTRSPAVSISYIASFGVGSIIGMTLLTCAASLPLRRFEHGAAWTGQLAMAGIGGIAIVIGSRIMLENYPSLGF
ncbi:MAG: urease accessory protein [Geminicoccaceae bacterium]|nr:high frequency lysogenization protein HflD [Geminicoccaceae bacterium]MCB9945102.1 urease accessory protein [Geminicoccaceae bacterium]